MVSKLGKTNSDQRIPYLMTGHLSCIKNSRAVGQVLVYVHTENKTLLLTGLAREQAMAKLGPRILKQVGDEFLEGILPEMEEVLSSLLMEAGPQEAVYFNITDQSSYGDGERIFHIYDVRSEKDVARFHVRRDKRPLEGYWFHFHYHLSKDNFEKHHQIGEIYWSKNTPPKWMA